MNNEFFDALLDLAREKGIAEDQLIDKIKSAIAIAIKRDVGGTDENVVDIDPASGRFYVAVRKIAVAKVENPATEILLQQAYKYDPYVQEGGQIEIPLETKQFGRIAAQAAKHVIRQGIREAERGQLLQKYEDKKYEIVSAPVVKVDPVKGNITLEIEKSETILPRSEQIAGEEMREGDRVMVYVVDVMASEKGPRMMISRTHPGLVKRLFEMETPEIKDGTVEIKAIAREAGSRTKMAVLSHDDNVDAVGACIGPKGSRVSAIVDELGGEKIDVVRYSDDPAQFITTALSPADVVSVEVDPDGAKSCHVTVPDHQLSLAIGNKGQNARLAARLTGWKIDIRPESGIFGEDPKKKEEEEEEEAASCAESIGSAAERAAGYEAQAD